MKTRARIWQRVSTGGQDEASQLPDCVGWCDALDYEYSLDESYVVHAKSAWKGKHQAMLDRAFADMAAGEYEVLVVWVSDRIERRGALAALTLAERARKAEGRIEYVKEPHLNMASDMSDTMLALAGDIARQESKRKSERIIAKQAALRSAGSAVGRTPWGYEIICTICSRKPVKPGCNGHKKIFRPTADGREYVPEIFRLVIEGESLRSIAAWLDAQGVKTTNGGPWNEGYLCNRLVKNPVYYGARRNSGMLETEPLVTASVWQEAQAALKTRARPGRRASVHPKALLAPICRNCLGVIRDGCADGISPMYRVPSGKGGQPAYRCMGHGPQRKGCGFTILVSEADDAVMARMLSDSERHAERIFIPGDDKSDAIARLRERGADAMRNGDYAAATECMTQAAELENGPRVRPHWKTVRGSQSEGEYFASLNPAQQREYLAKLEIMLPLDGQPLRMREGDEDPWL